MSDKPQAEQPTCGAVYDDGEGASHPCSLVHGHDGWHACSSGKACCSWEPDDVTRLRDRVAKLEAEIAHLRRPCELNELRAQLADATARANHLPGLTAALDEARYELQRLREGCEGLVKEWDASVGRFPMTANRLCAEGLVALLSKADE